MQFSQVLVTIMAFATAAVAAPVKVEAAAVNADLIARDPVCEPITVATFMNCCDVGAEFGCGNYRKDRFCCAHAQFKAA